MSSRNMIQMKLMMNDNTNKQIQESINENDEKKRKKLKCYGIWRRRRKK